MNDDLVIGNRASIPKFSSNFITHMFHILIQKLSFHYHIKPKLLQLMQIEILVKLHFPSVAALCKSFFCPGLVLGLSQVCLHMSFLFFFCPSNILVLPLFCPELSLESAQNPFDIVAMTFLSAGGFWQDLEGLQKAYL